MGGEGIKDRVTEPLRPREVDIKTNITLKLENQR